jgi:hypothetical protein
MSWALVDEKVADMKIPVFELETLFCDCKTERRLEED